MAELVSFLGAFAKLSKATSSFVYLLVCPPAWNISATTERIFMKFDIEDFQKICHENLIFVTIWQE
jgi:hypothetical protein